MAVKFFVPSAEDPEEAELIWSATRTFSQHSLGWEVSERRIFQINYQHGGMPYVAEVGRPDPRTGEVVQVILESEAYLVCTENRGVARGEPILIGTNEARTVEGFAPEN